MALTILCFHGCGQNADLFKSLLKSLKKNNKKHNWIFPQGKYAKAEGGWGWYEYGGTDSKVWTDDMDINQETRMTDIQDMIEYIGDKENHTVLIGFSEGGQFVLDLAQQLPNIHGVVAISPAYQKELGTALITCPTVLITSGNDDRVMKKYSMKWKKYMTDYEEVTHVKGHKVYLPLDTRDIIKTKLKL